MFGERVSVVKTKIDIKAFGNVVGILRYGDREFEGSPEQAGMSELLSEVYRREEAKRLRAAEEENKKLLEV